MVALGDHLTFSFICLGLIHISHNSCLNTFNLWFHYVPFCQQKKPPTESTNHLVAVSNYI